MFYNATSKWDYFVDIKSISIVPFGIESITKAASDAKGTTFTFILPRTYLCYEGDVLPATCHEFHLLN